MIEYDNYTLGLIGLVSFVLIAYDIWTYIKRGSDTTISVQMFELSKKYPIVAFLLGIVFGHIFWPLN